MVSHLDMLFSTIKGQKTFELLVTLEKILLRNLFFFYFIFFLIQSPSLCSLLLIHTSTRSEKSFKHGSRTQHWGEWLPGYTGLLLLQVLCYFLSH